MKKKFNKYKKLKTNSDHNMNDNMNADKNKSVVENLSKDEQNNIYPRDIQGLFERLGII